MSATSQPPQPPPHRDPVRLPGGKLNYYQPTGRGQAAQHGWGSAHPEDVDAAVSILEGEEEDGGIWKKRINRANGIPRGVHVSEAVANTSEIRKEAFLIAFEACGYVRKASEAAHVRYETVRHWRRDDPEFEVAFLSAQEASLVSLEDEARRRAYEGVLKPVFYKGEEVGATREYSDTLMMFLLKSGAPEKYRERAQLELTRGAEPPGIIEIHHDVTEEAYSALLADPDSGVERSEQDHSDDRRDGVGEDILRSKVDMEENE